MFLSITEELTHSLVQFQRVFSVMVTPMSQSSTHRFYFQSSCVSSAQRRGKQLKLLQMDLRMKREVLWGISGVGIITYTCSREDVKVFTSQRLLFVIIVLLHCLICENCRNPSNHHEATIFNISLIRENFQTNQQLNYHLIENVLTNSVCFLLY